MLNRVFGSIEEGASSAGWVCFRGAQDRGKKKRGVGGKRGGRGSRFGAGVVRR